HARAERPLCLRQAAGDAVVARIAVRVAVAVDPAAERGAVVVAVRGLLRAVAAAARPRGARPHAHVVAGLDQAPPAAALALRLAVGAARPRVPVRRADVLAGPAARPGAPAGARARSRRGAPARAARAAAAALALGSDREALRRRFLQARLRHGTVLPV